MFSLRVGFCRRRRSCSLPGRERAGQGAPMVELITASAVFCTRLAQGRHTREARERSSAPRKLNQWIFTSTGIQVLLMLFQGSQPLGWENN
jgi:hypothetical protein